MQLSSACFQILDELEITVEQIHQEDFCRPSVALSGATIGQHLRHTLEFFICLEKGVENGFINYDKRNHDKLIEGNKLIALAAISRIREFVSSIVEDKDLKLEVGYDRYTDDSITIPTNYFRELAYNIEHAIHHMAIVKIGVREIAPYVVLGDNFGVAVSTVRYREAAKG